MLLLAERFIQLFSIGIPLSQRGGCPSSNWPRYVSGEERSRHGCTNQSPLVLADSVVHDTIRSVVDPFRRVQASMDAKTMCPSVHLSVHVIVEDMLVSVQVAATEVITPKVGNQPKS